VRTAACALGLILAVALAACSPNPAPETATLVAGGERSFLAGQAGSAEGQEIIHTRFGAFIREGLGFVPYYPPGYDRPCRPRRPLPARADWNPLDDG
jgi:hypothetical protein